MKCRVFLMRHGETVWNQELGFRGRMDIPLSEKGVEQARRAASALSNIKLAAVYCSPLQRARHTAEIIARRQGLPVYIKEELNDLDFGVWEGLTLEEVQRRFPVEFVLWQKEPWRIKFVGGESLTAVRERAWRFFQEAGKTHRGEALIMVTHRVVLKLLLLAVMGLDNTHFWRLQQNTGAINVVDYWPGERINLRKYNETCHLYPVAESLRQQEY